MTTGPELEKRVPVILVFDDDPCQNAKKAALRCDLGGGTEGAKGGH